MLATSYKKMAGTSAVFLSSDYHGASPVERDGLVWSANELHLDEMTTHLHHKPAMRNALALEGLEDYDHPQDGDVRYVESVAVEFAYCARIQGWVQLI